MLPASPLYCERDPGVSLWGKGQQNQPEWQKEITHTNETLINPLSSSKTKNFREKKKITGTTISPSGQEISPSYSFHLHRLYTPGLKNADIYMLFFIKIRHRATAEVAKILIYFFNLIFPVMGRLCFVGDRPDLHHITTMNQPFVRHQFVSQQILHILCHDLQSGFLAGTKHF